MVRIAYVFPLVLVCLVGCRDAQQQSATLQPAGAHPLAAFAERNDDPIAAATDRFQRRLSADGTVPDRALLTAGAQRETVLSRSQENSAVFARGSWTWLGPGNIGGRLRPIVIHPTNPQIIYVGSASGGIWKTTDGGQSWFPLDDFLPSLAIADMVMHPDDPDRLFAGSGEGFFEAPEGSSNTAFVRGAGIFESTDAGATWNQMPSTDNPDFYFVNRLVFDPLDSNTMLAATLTGIWRTTDTGLTWSLRQSLEAMDVKFDPNNPLNVVAGGHDIVGGPYYSIDGGITWQQANGAEGVRQEFAWAPSQSGTVYAAVADGDGRIKVWRSTDSGQNYSLQTNGDGISTLAAYTGTIWVDPTDANFLIVGGQRLFRSTNGGVSLNQTFNAVHADMHRIVPHPDFDAAANTTVYFATDGGIYQTNNVYGSSAFDLNNNLGVTQFYGGAINPTTGHVVGGTQDNGTLFYSGDPQDWFHLFGGDGGYGAADPTDPNYFYGEVQRALIHRSTDGGQNAAYIYNGPNPIADAGSSATVNFIPFFLLDPNDPNRMLVACQRMWRSNNVKAGVPDWFPIKDSIEPPGGIPPETEKLRQSHYNPNSPFNLSTIAIAEGNSDIIWAAHNNGELYFTTNGTDPSPTWTRVDQNGVGLPNRWISTVVIDRNDHNHVYVAFMGWEDDNLWETTDSGLTWTDVSGSGATSIPDAPISALTIHRNIDGWLYVGTDVGIFTSIDNGVSWSTQSGGPGNAPVEQLLWKADDELLVVTHGRGMFLANVPGLNLDFEFPDGQPETLYPAGGTTVRVEVIDNGAIPVAGSGTLHVDSGGGFVPIPMQEIMPNVYDAVFPPVECGTIAKYFVSAESELAGEFTDPSNAPNSFFSAISASQIAVTFNDDFEQDLGWTVAGDATTGHWERGIPAGDGDRGDPLVDADGSGSCYLTENVAGDSDVDNGNTILTSPGLDANLSAGQRATISYYRWYSNVVGNDPMNDIFVVEVSNDGGSNWTNLETVGPDGPEVSGGWIFKSFDVTDLVTPNDQLQIRFIASDLGAGSVVEAAIDGVRLEVLDCVLLGDVNLDGLVNLLDVQPFIDVLSSGDYQAEADINQDGVVNLLDVQPFIDLLG